MNDENEELRLPALMLLLQCLVLLFLSVGYALIPIDGQMMLAVQGAFLTLTLLMAVPSYLFWLWVQ